MKKVIFSILCFVVAAVSHAQPVSTLQDDFNLECALSTGFPHSWLSYNPVAGTAAQGSWVCTSTDGRPTSTGSSTPGMQCSGVYGTPFAYHLDTAYLITPLLNFSSYAPHRLYLHFDTRVSKINLGGKLHIIKSVDTTFHSPGDTDMTALATPVIGPGDSSNWQTHQIEMTAYENETFYIAFRYTSTDTTGSTWYLDNVNITTAGLGVAQTEPIYTGLKVLGQSTPSRITIAYNTTSPANSELCIYDMLGRCVCRRTLDAHSNDETYTIDNLSLSPGLYCITVSNGRDRATVRTVVQ